MGYSLKAFFLLFLFGLSFAIEIPVSEIEIKDSMIMVVDSISTKEIYTDIQYNQSVHYYWARIEDLSGSFPLNKNSLTSYGFTPLDLKVYDYENTRTECTGGAWNHTETFYNESIVEAYREEQNESIVEAYRIAYNESIVEAYREIYIESIVEAYRIAYNESIVVYYREEQNETTDELYNETYTRTIYTPYNETYNKTIFIPYNQTYNKTIFTPYNETYNETVHTPYNETYNKTISTPYNETFSGDNTVCHDVWELSNERNNVQLKGQEIVFSVTSEQKAEGFFNPPLGVCGGTLTTPNTVFTLNQTILTNDSTCLTVGAENITVDCAGFTIQGNNSTTTDGIYSTQFNTTVKNCIILNFSRGIVIDGEGADYANITNNTINLTFSTDCTQTTGECSAVNIIGGDNASITHNTHTSHRYGVLLYTNANDNLVQSNRLISNLFYGVRIDSSLNNTIVYNNVTAGSYGILAQASDYSNISFNNVSAGEGSAGDFGIFLNSADFSYVQYNKVTVGDDWGINLATSIGNIVQYNNVTSPSSNAIRVQSNSHNNTFTYNYLDGSNDAFLISTSNTNNVSYNNISAGIAGGLVLSSADGTTIKYNNISAGQDRAFEIITSDYNNASYNNVTAGDDTAMLIDTSNHNTVEHNNISNLAGDDFGIEMTNSDYNRIDNNTVYADDWYGIYLSSCENNNITNNDIDVGDERGIYLTGSDDNLISNNYVTAPDRAIYLLSASNNTVQYNNASTSSDYAIYISSSTNNNITNNNATAGNDYAISLLSSSNDNIIQYNNATASGYTIFISAATNNIIQYNTASASEIGTIFLSASFNNTFTNNNVSMSSTIGSYSAIYITGAAANNTFTDNIINSTATGTSEAPGIFISEGENNIFINNSFGIASSASTPAIYVPEEDGVGNNTFYYNNITSSAGWVQDLNGTNHYNSTGIGNRYFWTNGTEAWEVYDIYSTEGTTWANEGSDRPFNTSNVAEFLGTGYPEDWYPYTENTCGELSSAGTTYTLTANSYIAGATCFTVTAENVTLECDGFSISGDNSSATRGIYSDQFNTTIKNCYISNFSTGIYITGDAADYANITDNIIDITDTTSCSATNGECNAVFISAADFANISRNIVNAHEFAMNIRPGADNTALQHNNITSDSSSAFVMASDNNILTNNIILSTDPRSLDLSGSENNYIAYNNITSENSYAIEMTSASDENIIEYNNITSANDYGIYISGDDNTIQHNYISNTVGDDYGIYMEQSDRNRIDNNTVYADDWYGIYLTSSASNNITNNIVDVDDQRGIYLTGSTTINNLVSNNYITAPANAIRLESSSSYNTIQYNNASSPNFAIFLVSSNNNTVQYNNASATDYAIYLATSSSNNTIKYNNFSASSNYAIYMGASGNDNNTFTNNSLDTPGTAISWTDNDDGTNNSFVENNITADVWINDKEGGNFYNDSSVGNRYWWTNGTEAWEVYDITCSGATPCWADGGTDRPLDNSTATAEWIELGNDSHPYTENGGGVVHNAFINITAQNLTPLLPTPSEDLNCNITATTNDTGTLVANTSWFKNGVNQTALAVSHIILNNTNTAIANLSSSETSTGEDWSCEVIVGDGTNVSISNMSENVTIQAVAHNALIQITNVSIYSSAGPYVGGYIAYNETCQTNDTGTLTYYTSVFKNGANQTGLANSTTVTNATEQMVFNQTTGLVKGDTWNFTGYCSDGINTSATEITQGITVQNSPPTNTTIGTLINSTTDASFLVNASVDDADGAADINYSNISNANGTCAYFSNQSGANIFHITYNCTGTGGQTTSLNISFNDTSNANITTANIVNTYPVIGFVCSVLDQENSTVTFSPPAEPTCYNITAKNVTLNCQGYSLFGLNESFPYGVYSNQPSTTVKNCNISNFSYGIFYENSSNSTITNNTINGSYTWNTYEGGIHYINGSNATIANNTITVYGGEGISAYSFNNSIIENNTVTVIREDGFGIDIGDLTPSSSNNDIIRNTVIMNTTCCDAILMSSNINDSRISLNNITTNVSDSGSGALGLSSYCNYTNNTIYAPLGNAIYVPNGGVGNIVYHNNITSDIWVNDASTTTNYYNTTGQGNIYYFANGTASWEVYNITTDDGTNWSNAGSDRPFNASLTEWIGLGNDSHPFTENPTIVNTPPTLTVDLTFKNASAGHWFTMNATASDEDGFADITNWIAQNSSGNCANYSTNTSGISRTVSFNCTDANLTGNFNITFVDASSASVNTSTLQNTYPNKAPVLGAPNITPDPAYTIDTLTCNAGSYSDIDGDAEDTGARVWSWYKNNTLIGGETTQTLANTNFGASDLISCNQTTHDNLSLSSNWNYSTNVTIEPIVSFNTTNITAISVVPITATRTDIISCNTTVQGNGSLNFTIQYNWYQNGVNQTALAGSDTILNNTPTLISNISGNHLKGENWSCDAQASGGGNISEWNMSANITIQNSPPVNASVGDYIDATTGHWFTANGTVDDADGGTDINFTNSTESGEFISNGTVENTFWALYNYSSDTPNSITPKIGFSDTSGSYTDATGASHDYPDPNNASLTAPSISPDPAFTDDTLTCNNGVFSDADGDVENVSSRTFRWFKNTTIIGGETSQTLSNTTFGASDSIICEETSVAQNWTGSLAITNSSAVVIQALAGQNYTNITVLEAVPIGATRTDTISCNITVIGNGSASYEVQFNWFKNNVNQTGLAGLETVSNNTPTLISNLSTGHLKEENWSCEARANGGNALSDWNMSANLTIANSPPVNATIGSMSNASVGHWFTFNASIDDADGASDIANSSANSTFGTCSELSNESGVNIFHVKYNCTSSSEGSTTITVNFTDTSDATNETSAITNNYPDHGANLTAPTLTPIPSFTNSTITCTPGSWSDTDQDPENTTSRTYQWFKNDTNISGAFNSTTLSSDNFGKTDEIICEEFTSADNWQTISNNRTNSSTLTISNSNPVNATIDTYTNNSLGHDFNITASAEDADGALDIQSTNISNTGGTCIYLSNSTSGNKFTGLYNCNTTTEGNATNIIIGFTDKGSLYNETSTGSNTYPDHQANLSSPTITPDPAFTVDTLTCNAGTWSDIDQDPENVTSRTWRWFWNGSLISGQTTNTLANTFFNVTDEIICEERTEADNFPTISTNTTNSSTLTISSSLDISSIEINSNATSLPIELRCNFTATGEGSLTANYSFYRDGILYFNDTAPIINGVPYSANITVTNIDTMHTDAWTCLANVTNTTNTSSTETSTNNITISVFGSKIQLSNIDRFNDSATKTGGNTAWQTVFTNSFTNDYPDTIFYQAVSGFQVISDSSIVTEYRLIDLDTANVLGITQRTMTPDEIGSSSIATDFFSVDSGDTFNYAFQQHKTIVGIASFTVSNITTIIEGQYDASTNTSIVYTDFDMSNSTTSSTMQKIANKTIAINESGYYKLMMPTIEISSTLDSRVNFMAKINNSNCSLTQRDVSAGSTGNGAEFCFAGKYRPGDVIDISFWANTSAGTATFDIPNASLSQYQRGDISQFLITEGLGIIIPAPNFQTTINFTYIPSGSGENYVYYAGVSMQASLDDSTATGYFSMVDDDTGVIFEGLEMNRGFATANTIGIILFVDGNSNLTDSGKTYINDVFVKITQGLANISGGGRISYPTTNVPIYPVPFSCNTTLRENNEYTLESDINSTGTCFNVTAPDVTIDCQGFSITGDNSSGSYGTLVQNENATIRNCTFHSFETGIGTNSTNLTAYYNNFTTTYWMNDSGSSNYMNTTGAGNIYYFINGTASWDVYNITTNLPVPNWANNGTDYPFDSNLNEWIGTSNDSHPWTENQGNLFPIINTISIIPTFPLSTDVLQCSVNASNGESSQLNISYEFYKNGVNQTALAGSINITNNTLTNIANVSDTLTDITQNWSCRARAYDGVDYTDWEFSDNITISNIWLNASLFYPYNGTVFGPGQCSVIGQVNVTSSVPSDNKTGICRLYSYSGDPLEDYVLVGTDTQTVIDGIQNFTFNITPSSNQSFRMNCTVTYNSVSQNTSTQYFSVIGQTLCFFDDGYDKEFVYQDLFENRLYSDGIALLNIFLGLWMIIQIILKPQN